MQMTFVSTEKVNTAQADNIINMDYLIILSGEMMMNIILRADISSFLILSLLYHY